MLREEPNPPALQGDRAVLHLNGTAVGTAGQFVFNTTTHTLVWDSNGTSAGGVTATIVFDNNVNITKADLVFLV